MPRRPPAERKRLRAARQKESYEKRKRLRFVHVELSSTCARFNVHLFRWWTKRDEKRIKQEYMDNIDKLAKKHRSKKLPESFIEDFRDLWLGLVEKR